MITPYAFDRILVDSRGETKDLWVHWALEELGLPYRVHALDHTGSELHGEAYSRINAFHHALAIDDHGLRAVLVDRDLALSGWPPSGAVWAVSHRGRTVDRSIDTNDLKMQEGKARPRAHHLPAIIALMTLRRKQAGRILERRKAA